MYQARLFAFRALIVVGPVVLDVSLAAFREGLSEAGAGVHHPFGASPNNALGNLKTLGPSTIENHNLCTSQMSYPLIPQLGTQLLPIGCNLRDQGISTPKLSPAEAETSLQRN